MPHSYEFNEGNIGELDQMAYVFIAVDKCKPCKSFAGCLVGKSISLIDADLGVNIVDWRIYGRLRLTTVAESRQDHLADKMPGTEGDNNEYATNMQIAQLNAMNAVMAVIRWKKLSGFYADLPEEHHSSQLITISKIINDDTNV